MRAYGHIFKELKEIGPDALIIADPGVFEIAKEVCPEIPRHNQYTVRTIQTMVPTSSGITRERRGL